MSNSSLYIITVKFFSGFGRTSIPSIPQQTMALCFSFGISWTEQT